MASRRLPGGRYPTTTRSRRAAMPRISLLRPSSFPSRTAGTLAVILVDRDRGPRRSREELPLAAALPSRRGHADLDLVVVVDVDDDFDGDVDLNGVDLR